MRCIAMVALYGCSASAPPARPPDPPTTAATPDAAPDNALPVDPLPPDAAPIRPIDVIQASGRAGTTLFWRLPTSPACQEWRMETANDDGAKGRILRVGGMPIGFRYEIAGDEVVLEGSFAADDSRSFDHCEQRLRPTADDSTKIAFATGNWYLTAKDCAAATSAMPRGCAAMVATLTHTRTPGAKDPLPTLLRSGGKLHLLTDKLDCEIWTIAKKEMFQRSGNSKTSYGIALEPGGKIALTGPNETGPGGGYGIGDYQILRVDPLSPTVVLVGGFPWFLRAADCEAAQKLAAP